MTTAPGGTAGTATILFTDLVSSTALRTELGEERADELRRRHDEALRTAITNRGGTIIKGLGDGLMATFPSAADGVAGAVAAQEAVARLDRRLGRAGLTIRAGVSAGDVVWEDGDVFGEAVVEASRLCSAAGGGDILCSDIVRVLARGRGGHEFVPVGALELRGLPEPVAAYRVRWSEPRPTLPLPPALRTRSPFPYVGRTDVRDVLGRSWKRALSGEPTTVLVAGEPGVGKTRLVAELAAEAHAEGAVILAGGCDEQVAIPYQPVIEALRHFLAHCPEEERQERLGVHAGNLVRLAPELSGLVEVGAETFAGDDDAERSRVFDAIACWLGAAGHGEPVMLVLDDLHWADSATVLLLRHLVRRARVRGLLIVATYRDTDVDRAHPLAAALADLRREADVARIHLHGLTAEEVAAFLAAAAGHELGATGGALAQALHEETEGNPFFLEEVILNLIETRAIFQGPDGRWTSDRLTIDDLGIPEGVREVVGRRLSRLSDDCNRLLALAAVLGPSFDVPTLQAVAEGNDTVIDGLEEAERAGLLAEAVDVAAGYAFTHALVRQTLLDELSLARRQQYHLRAADALERSGRAKPAAVAFHYRAAGAAADPERAVTASLLAAEQARQQLAFEEASEHWEAALEILELSGDDPGRTARLLELLGDVMYATARDWQRGLAQLERAASIYDDIGNEVAAAKVRVKIGRNLSTFADRVDVQRAFANYEAAERVLRQRPTSPSYGYLLVARSTGLTFRADHRAGEDAAAQALEIAVATSNDSLKTNAELLLGWHRGHFGHLDEAFGLIGTAQARAVELGNPVLSFLGTWIMSGLAMSVLDYGEALATCDRELQSGRLDGATGFRTAVTQLRTGALLWLGRQADARQVMEQVPLSAMNQRFLEWVAGSWEQAEQGWLDLAAGARAVGNRWNTAGFTLQAAQLREMTGDAAGALALSEELGDMAQDGTIERCIVDASWARTLPHVGRDVEARRCADRCREHLERTSWRGLDALLEIAVAVTADRAEAEARLLRAIECTTTFDNPTVRADALTRLGVLSGRADHVDAAIAIYERAGMGVRWVERARSIRASL